MGTVRIHSMCEEDGKAIFTIDPPFMMRGEEISHVVVTNINGNLLKAEPCYENGTPVSKGWNYTVPGTTIESLHKMVIKLKNLNGNLNSNVNKLNQLKKAAAKKRTA